MILACWDVIDKPGWDVLSHNSPCHDALTVVTSPPDQYRDHVPDPHRNGDHLKPTCRLWPDPQQGPWLLTFRWQVIGGRAECVGLDIASTLPRDVIKERCPDLPAVGQPLRTTTLRDLKLSELLHEERVHADHLAVKVPASDGPGAAGSVPASMRPATRRRLELVAQTYEQAHAQGDRPTQAVADRLKVTAGAAANLVMRARQAGMLPASDVRRSSS
jgi:hypothetical protein